MNHVEEWLSRQDGIGQQLRRLRLQTGLSGKGIAASTGWQQSKVSRLEKSRQLPSAEDIRQWVQVCGADPAIAFDLIDRAAQARAGYRDWKRRLASLGPAGMQAGYNTLVAKAHHICHFEMTVMPGMLQTADYARCVFLSHPRLAEADGLEEAIATRVRRQQYLYDTTKRFEFLLAEPVLRWLFCPPEVMRAQLDRLQTVIGLPNVRFGVLPLDRQLVAKPFNAFQLIDGLVTVETLVGELTHQGDEADLYAERFEKLWGDAVTGDGARSLILRAAAAISPGGDGV